MWVHELSVCQALLDEVARIAAGRGADAVCRIDIEVGPLCGVDPRLIAEAFSVLRTGSCAARAQLAIHPTGVWIRCLHCGAQSQVQPNRLVCARCGGFRSRVIAGEELRLIRVELQPSGQCEG